MTLSPNSRIIRYAFFFKTDREKRSIHSISLCRLFWKCVFNTFIFSLPIAFLGAWLRLLFLQPLATCIVTLIIAIIIGLLVLYVKYEDDINEWRYKREVAYREARAAAYRNKPYTPPSKWKALAKEAFWGIKNRVCPQIYIR